MNYMFTLEWLEGASLIQVHRLLSGQPLYAQPSFEYVSLIYSPLYFYLSSLLARIIGFGFLPLRLVSFASTMGCVALIYLIARKHTADNYSSLMAAGSFLALYKISDTWFDLARVDMLALFLALLAVYLMQTGSTYPAGVGRRRYFAGLPDQADFLDCCDPHFSLWILFARCTSLRSWFSAPGNIRCQSHASGSASITDGTRTSFIAWALGRARVYSQEAWSTSLVPTGWIR